MSADNFMYLRSKHSLYETLKTIVGGFESNFAFKPDPATESKTYFAVSNKGSIMVARYNNYPPSDLGSKIGFEPNCYVISDLGDFIEEIRLDFINRISTDLDWDVLMLQLDSYVDLLKIGFEISLNINSPTWTEERLRQLKFKYSTEMPFNRI